MKRAATQPVRGPCSATHWPPMLGSTQSGAVPFSASTAIPKVVASRIVQKSRTQRPAEMKSTKSTRSA